MLKWTFYISKPSHQIDYGFDVSHNTRGKSLDSSINLRYAPGKFSPLLLTYTCEYRRRLHGYFSTKFSFIFPSIPAPILFPFCPVLLLLYIKIVINIIITFWYEIGAWRDRQAGCELMCVYVWNLCKIWLSSFTRSLFLSISSMDGYGRAAAYDDDPSLIHREYYKGGSGAWS